MRNQNTTPPGHRLGGVVLKRDFNMRAFSSEVGTGSREENASKKD
jgi:hypothetical protein